MKHKRTTVALSVLVMVMIAAGVAEGLPADTARALAAQPQCVLYDEPTTMVDPIMSDRLSDLMLRLKKQLKLTSVVVTHDLDLMYKVAGYSLFPQKLK